MLKIREVKTASNNIAIQVIYYLNYKRIVIKHIGSAKDDKELSSLRQIAIEFIKDKNGQLSIFSEENPNAMIFIEHSHCVGFYYNFFYSVIEKIMDFIGFSNIATKLFQDLVIIRILEPASKLRSIELMDTYFGIVHRRQSYYRDAKKYLSLKEKVEQTVVDFAMANHSFDYSLIFNDVTTLYFETFDSDEFRETGFSKDNKTQQPQILVALMVNREGLPIGFDVFSGSTLEGHTIIPAIKSFITKYKVENFTVVADAAMISSKIIEQLKQDKIHYIIGARLGNLRDTIFAEIDAKIIRKDGKIIRVQTDKGTLICSYSDKRYRKDKYEMERQLLKAQSIVEKPSKNKKAKFVATQNEKIVLNEKLIQKTEKLLGLKGYYTDIDENTLSNTQIIERYHELYKIEQSFRIAKSDLQTRPIFHFKEDPIRLHILICFMALVISKHIELRTNVSIKRFIMDCKKVADGRMINTITEKEVTIKGKLTQTVINYLQLLNCPH